MVEPQVTPAAETEQDFVLTRTFAAPRALVFKVYTEAEHLAKWWGPKGFTMLSCTLDLRPGGLFHYGMQAPNGGGEMWGKFVYHEIVAPEKIVFVNSFSDAEGNTVRAPFSPEWPLEVLNTLTFTEADGQTTITMRGGPINATEAERKLFVSMHGSMQQGYKGTLDHLEAYLAEVLQAR